MMVNDVRAVRKYHRDSTTPLSATKARRSGLKIWCRAHGMQEVRDLFNGTLAALACGCRRKI
jgi:hypothetical protein